MSKSIYTTSLKYKEKMYEQQKKIHQLHEITNQLKQDIINSKSICANCNRDSVNVEIGLETIADEFSQIKSPSVPRLDLPLHNLRHDYKQTQTDEQAAETIINKETKSIGTSLTKRELSFSYGVIQMEESNPLPISKSERLNIDPVLGDSHREYKDQSIQTTSRNLTIKQLIKQHKPYTPIQKLSIM